MNHHQAVVTVRTVTVSLGTVTRPLLSHLAAILTILALPLSAALAQSFSNQEFVRNGAFEFATTLPAGYASGWHSSTFNARVEAGVDPQGGNALRLDADAEGAFVHQEIYLPDSIQSATLSLRVRVINRYDNLPPLAGSLINGSVGVVPYTDGDQIDLNNALLGAALLEANAAGPTGWVERSFPLDAEAIGILNTARSQNRRLALYFAPNANNERQSLLLDNVSFRFNGSYTPVPQSGQIAFVQGRELRRIAPTGGSAQTVWTAPPTANVLDGVRWRPDGEEIAFVSDHETVYSAFLEDVYAIGAGGAGLRRMSNAPSQQAIASGGFPGGTVRLTITNNYSHVSGDTISSFFVLVRGAEPVQVNLPAFGQSVLVTVPNVARFVAGPQSVIFFYSSNRCSGLRRDIGGQVTVVANATVDQSLQFNAVNCTGVRATAQELSWKRDSTELGYTVTNSPFKLPVAGSGGAGSSWFSTAAFIGALSWSPTGDHLLHTSVLSTGSTHIWKRQPSSGDQGDTLIAEGPQLAIPDQPAWLPNASGFLYTMSRDVHQADANGSNRQRLTVAGRGERFARPSPSPGGTWLVFERRLDNHGGSDEISLWLMQRDRPASLRPLATGRTPDWSRVEPAAASQIFATGFE